MIKRDYLLVSETFYTLQGEGQSTGKPAFFLRLGACNLHCKWCDTPYTWAFGKRADYHESGLAYSAHDELDRLSIDKAASEILESSAGLCVITGGEPLMQLETLAALVSRVNESLYAPVFEIETAGTLSPGELILFENISFNVSPKLATSGNTKAERYKPDVLQFYSGHSKAIFKFVVDTRRDSRSIREDIQEIEGICRVHAIPAGQVWLMPCATKQSLLVDGLRMLAPIALEHHWNLTNRLHVTLWGDKRGH
jgi:7-carboxy-7-deazaguanine synthase